MEENIKIIEQNTENNLSNESACACGSGGCGCHSQSIDHSHSHHPADLPVRFKILRQGDRVVELGSGTGNDCFTAAQVIGLEGKVVGIDISEKNISTARDYMDQLRISNVEFRHGDIHNIPLPKEYADVVLTNCVFNLQDDKQKVADEMYRIANHNGFVCVSDFVLLQQIPDGIRQDGAELAGCIAGAENINDFMDYFRRTGFVNVEIVEMSKVHLPDDIFHKYLSSEEVERYKDIYTDEGIFNVTLIGEKPSECSAETCCCNPDKHANYTET